MNEACGAPQSPLLSARLEKIGRVTRAGKDWQASLLKFGVPRLEEDGSVTYSFSPQVARTEMEPYLTGLSERVGFRILGEYRALPVAELGDSQSDGSGAAVKPAQVSKDRPLDTALQCTGIKSSSGPQATPEPISEHDAEEKRSPKQARHKTRDNTKRAGVPQDIRASESFRKLPRNGQGILKLMYRLSKFDRAASQRACGVSRNGLASLQRVSPRTVSNLWKELERLFLVRRLKRGSRNSGVSVFELPYNYSHVRLWRMEAAGKRRY